MNEILNPYIAGAPVVETSMFFGREAVFSWIERSLAGRYTDHILVLHGQRRVGKTSVLKQIPNFLPTRYIQVFFDLQGRTNTTLDRFLWWLSREITRTLKQERGYNLTHPDRASFAADNEIFINEFLPSLRDSLGDQVLLLTFDEFDTLDRSEIQETLALPLIAYLRRLMEFEWLNFIFSIGSSGDKLENMQASYTDFFKSALYRKISFLEPEDCHRLITKPVEGVISYDQEAVEKIVQITSGHPYFSQLMCHELFSLCQKTGKRDIKLEDVESILEDVVERGTVNLKFVWDEANDLEKWVLAGLARSDGHLNSMELSKLLQSQRVRFSDSDLNSALIHLQDKDVLTKDNRFIIHLMKLWLQTNRSMDRVREELVETNPIANRYVEIGDEYRDLGQFDPAVESYRQALSVDPKNLKAQLSIAGIQFETGAYADAAAAYESAMQIEEEDVAARTGYCDTYLALGDIALQQNQINKAVQHFQNAVRINPVHRDALQRLSKIHLESAESLLALGEDEKALNEFFQAKSYAPEDKQVEARYDQVLEEKKDKAIASLLGKAEQCLMNRHWDEAAKMVGEALKLDPQNPALQDKLVEIKDAPRQQKINQYKLEAEGAIAKGNFEGAISAIETLILLAPKEKEYTTWLDSIKSDQFNTQLRVYKERAEKALSNGDWDTAIQSWREASQLAPEDPVWQSRIAEARQAEQQAQQEKHLANAAAARTRGDWESALSALESYRKLVPDDESIQVEIEAVRTERRKALLVETKSQAESAAAREDWTEAVSAWEAYLELNPDDQTAFDKLKQAQTYTKLSQDYSNAQTAIRKKRYGQAVNLLQGIIAQDPAYKSSSRLLVEAVEISKRVPVWRKPWFYALLVGFVVLVTGVFVGPRIWETISTAPVYTPVTPTTDRTADATDQPILDGSTPKPTPTVTPDPRILNPANQHFYRYYSDSNNSWHDARDYCAAQGGYLVTIQNAAENEFVLQLSNGFTWLGASDENTEGIWEWVSGELLEYTNWSDGQPDNNNDGEGTDEDYLEISTTEFPTQWNDRPEGYLPFVCEWEPTDSNRTLSSIGSTLTVTSANDQGVGTLRQALLDAQAGDTITFNPEVFPPGRPTTIFLTSEHLPRISQGAITIDASNAGVILDGSQLPENGNFGLVISSNRNTVMGLQIFNTGIGIYLEGGSYNQIGGDRTIGTGPLGQGNLLSNNGTGIDLLSMAGGNIITGNLIGTDVSGTKPMGNWSVGIHLEENRSYHPVPNIIGPDNVIAYNGHGDAVAGGEIPSGIRLATSLMPATITANLIYDNLGTGIRYYQTNAPKSPPAIRDFDLEAGIVSGQTCGGCVVEVFSTDTHAGKIYEGAVSANQNGDFTFRKGEALTGPYLTATTRSPGGSTSEFSISTAVQTVLDFIQTEPPLYQTSFDTWEFGDPVENASLENGKLILTSPGENVNVPVSYLSSNRLAIEFDLHILESNSDGVCYFGTNNSQTTDENFKSFGFGFTASGQTFLEYFEFPGDYPRIANSSYLNTESNTVTLIILSDKNLIAAFVNGQMAFTIRSPYDPAEYAFQSFSAEWNIGCEYDNYKVWDLNGIDLSAAIIDVAPPLVSAPASERLLYTKQITSGAITDLAWSEHKEIGDLIAIVGRDTKLKFIHGLTGQTHDRILQSQYGIVSGAWNLDGGGDKLAIGDTNGLVTIYRNVQELTQLLDGPYPIDSLQGDGEVTALRFGDISQTNDSGNDLAASTSLGYVIVWDALNNTGTILWRRQIDSGSIFDIDWNRETKQILTVSENEGVQAWNASNGSRLQKLEFQSRSAVWSPDGRYIALEDRSSGTSTLFVIQSGAIKANVALSTLVNQVIWSPDGTKIATAGQDGVVRIWNGIDEDGQVSGLNQLYSFDHDTEVTAIVWSPDSSVLVAGDANGAVCAWDLSNLDTSDSTAATSEPDVTFFKPILAYMEVQPTTFENDISPGKAGWGGTSEGTSIISGSKKDDTLAIADHIKPEEVVSGTPPDWGVMGVSFPTNGLFDAADFALKFSFELLDWDFLYLQFRSASTRDSGYRLVLYNRSSKGWELINLETGDLISSGTNLGNSGTLQLIAGEIRWQYS